MGLDQRIVQGWWVIEVATLNGESNRPGVPFHDREAAMAYLHETLRGDPAYCAVPGDIDTVMHPKPVAALERS
jgi:hypothetical protein